MHNKYRGKVLMVAQYYPPHLGGLEVVAQKNAESLACENYDVTVLTIKTKEYKQNTEDNNIRVIRLPAFNLLDEKFGIPFAFVGLGFIITLFKELKKADIVHVHDTFYLTSWLTYFLCRTLNKPLFLTQHVGVVKYPLKIVVTLQSIIYKLIGDRIFSYAKHIIVYNKNVYNFLLNRKVDRSKILLSYNGIDLKLFNSKISQSRHDTLSEFALPNGKPIILFVGRFVHKKGYDQLYRAADPRYTIVFVGSGNIPVEWKENPNVFFIGPFSHEKLIKLYRAADIFVFPAVDEIFTLVMQEAMAVGLPVITTDDPGYTNYDVDRTNVLFVNPNPVDLKKSILTVIENSTLRVAMSQYSKEFAQLNFDWNKNFKSTLVLYERVMSNKKW